MQTFPTKGNGLTRGESPSLYKIDWEDNVLKAPADGGYEFRRRKFTRTPPRMIETGYIGLSHADYLVLEAFWLEHQNDTEFLYPDYMTGTTRTVRFDDFKPDYTGYGQTKVWGLKIKLKEV